MHIRDFEGLLQHVDENFFILNTRPDKCSLSYKGRGKRKKMRLNERESEKASDHVMSLPYNIYKHPIPEYVDENGIQHRSAEAVLEILDTTLNLITKEQRRWIEKRL